MNARDNGHLARKLGIAGSVLGTAAFLAFGLLQGTLIGGTAALQAGAYLFGDATLACRAAAAAGMLAGAVLAGAVFIGGGFATGWLMGAAAGHSHGTVKAPDAVRHF